MKLSRVSGEDSWVIHGIADAPLVISDRQLDELAAVTAFRLGGVLQRDHHGGLVLVNDESEIHVAFSDEADELLDSLRAQSALNPLESEA